MSLAGNKFYIQGFSLDRTKTSVQLIQSLFNNSITSGNKVTISFKSGAKASDFSGILPSGISIVDGERSLSSLRITKLIPNVITLNEHSVECYDIENRVMNYLVTQDRATALIETSHHTAFIILASDINDEVKLRSILDSSIYFKFLSIPLGQSFSYPLVNTHSSNLKYLSERDAPTYLSRYTPYKMEYSKVLLGFYEAIKPHVPGFEVYLNRDPITGDSSIIDSNRVSITLEGLGNTERRPYMLDRDILQNSALLTINIQTNDHLKYSFIKDSYQNLTSLSNLARFYTQDSYGENWMTHVEWESFKDMTKMADLRDEGGRFSYLMTLQCSLYYYVVKDELYSIIKVIDTNYINMDTRKDLFLNNQK